MFDANGGSSVDFSGGTTILAADYTLTTSDRSAAGLNGYRVGSATDAYARAAGDNDLTVNLSATSTLLLDSSRESTLVAFDFSKTSNGTFTTENGATIGLHTDRLLFSVDRDYLVADDISLADLDAALANLEKGNAVTDIFGRDDDSLWISAHHDSRFDPLMRRWSNLFNAGRALETILRDDALTSDAEFDAVTRYLASATPSHAANSAIAALGLSGRVAAKAVELSDPAAIGDPCLTESTPRARPAVRLWGGYIGSFERMDSHNRYQGYKQYSNGALVGGSVDFAAASVGGYFGYTRSRLTMRDDANGRVTADGYHTGITASAAPFRELPNLRLSGDVGFVYYDTSSRRFDGTGTVYGSASQRPWTAGLAARYDACFGPAAVTPFASFRWTGIRQNAFAEQGGLTAARVDKMSADSLASELGVRLSRTWNGLTPYALAGWRHEFGDRDIAATAFYNANPSTRYRLASVDRDRDAILLGAGLSAKRTLASGNDLGATIGYAASVGSHGTEHSVSATVGLSF